MGQNSATPPDRLETAGSVDELGGDADAEGEDSTLTALDPGGDVGPDQGGTPGDASGESGDPGSAAR